MTSPNDGNTSPKADWLSSIAHPCRHRYDISVTRYDHNHDSGFKLHDNPTLGGNTDSIGLKPYQVTFTRNTPCILDVNHTSTSLRGTNHSWNHNSKESQTCTGSVQEDLTLKFDSSDTVSEVKLTDPSIWEHFHCSEFNTIHEKQLELKPDRPVQLHQSDEIALQGRVALEVRGENGSWKSCPVKDCTMRKTTYLGRCKE